ncbi:MAG: TMEM175 family protein [Chthoniobacterales bacterium]
MSEGAARGKEGRFTSRLEAFSDLVFGFSLSLLATRLDVPARVEDIFDPARWFAVIGTFGLVCRFWLEHYRIFRHGFVAEVFDAVVNFIFLFAIAILPYTVQTFLRFFFALPSFSLYVGDFMLILLTLGVLRMRSLQQRRADPDVADRLRVWRRTVSQFVLGVLMGCLLIALYLHGDTVSKGFAHFSFYILVGFAGTLLCGRFLIRKLPAFLA